MGLEIPAGKITRSEPEGLFHYRDFIPIADAMEDLFRHHGAPVKPSSHLDRILRAARELGARADEPNDISVSAQAVFDAHCCARLATSVLALDYRPAHKHFFFELQNGSLNFWNSERSKAKDTEWELFLWAHFNRNMPNSAELFEPDILLRLPFRPVGIACKRAYSEQSVFRQIEEGARQIRDARIPGIVAVSLDFFVDRDNSTYSHLKAADAEQLQRATLGFLEKVWRDVGPRVSRKFLLPGRVLGVIFALQSYVAFPEKPNSFIEAIATRFQSDDLGPAFSTQVMDYLHQTLGMNPSAGFAGSSLPARIQRLKELKPPAAA